MDAFKRLCLTLFDLDLPESRRVDDGVHHIHPCVSLAATCSFSSCESYKAMMLVHSETNEETCATVSAFVQRHLYPLLLDIGWLISDLGTSQSTCSSHVLSQLPKWVQLQTYSISNSNTLTPTALDGQCSCYRPGCPSINSWTSAWGCIIQAVRSERKIHWKIRNRNWKWYDVMM